MVADISGSGLTGLRTQLSVKKKCIDNIYSCKASYKKPKKSVANGIVDLSAGLLSLVNIDSTDNKLVVSSKSEVGSIETDLVIAKWSVFMRKDSVCMTKAISNKQTWIFRDQHQALLYTFSVGITAHDLTDLLVSYGEKTCIIGCNPNSYDATVANAVMFSDVFITSEEFSDLDAMWDGFDGVFTKESFKFHKLKLLVLKIDLVNSDVKLDHIHFVFFSVKKSYYVFKLAKSLRVEESNIRSAIDKRIESFEVNKDHTIRSVLEHPFYKIVLDYLVVDDKIILEPDMVKIKVDVIMKE
ncbi:hypothetical protein G9A89_007538 [Geosiphon pyriformis]|nr:hypothetical protein G9A89_007538 [Geosiphon pyriformis]